MVALPRHEFHSCHLNVAFYCLLHSFKATNITKVKPKKTMGFLIVLHAKNSSCKSKEKLERTEPFKGINYECEIVENEELVPVLIRLCAFRNRLTQFTAQTTCIKHSSYKNIIPPIVFPKISRWHRLTCYETERIYQQTRKLKPVIIMDTFKGIKALRCSQN